MNFSNLYIIYPVNRQLERAIADTIGMFGEELLEAAAPDNSITVADNFRYSRGNYEQHRFNSNILETLSEALQATLTDEFHQQEPAGWAELQNRLGNVLAALAQQQGNAELYEKAIACFTNALTEFDQDKTPLGWAVTHYNLATANQALGRLQENTKAFKTAVDAYTNALLVYKREETPEEWMFCMHQLGATLHAYGKLLKGNRNLQKSVVAYKNALAVLDADNYALELTATHNNRAAVLHHLAESEENADRLKEAINSYEKAWKVSMEQQLPVHIAVICRVNKATAQNVLAELTNDARLADEVADEFDVILECFSHALQPLCVKHCEAQMNKARSLA